MSDNVNIIVQDTINEIVVNSAVTVETIDINVQVAVDEVTIIAKPNEYIINVNRIIGEQVQSDWNETDDQAPDYIKNKPIIPAAVTKTSDLINDGEDGVNPFITLEDIPVVEGFVPYTGATQDVNLGEFGIQLGNLEFDTTPTNAPTGVGSLVWNDTAGTLDLKLKGNNVTLQIGQETVARVVNKTATNVTLLESKYQIVRVTGAQGQRPKVDLALANNDLNSTTTLGLVTETIANNQEGFITTSGQVQQINTTGSIQGETWADGDVLYLSGTVAGQATNIKPIAPIHTVIVGFVEYAHITQGKIFVKVDNGYELEELHNVSAVAPNNNEVLTYDSATLLWKPKAVFQLPSLTSGSVLFSDGTTIAQDNANFFWNDTNNRLGIGTNAPTARLHIKAPGALSTDIALRVRNSADTANLFSVSGDGIVTINNAINNNGLTVLGFGRISARKFFGEGYPANFLALDGFNITYNGGYSNGGHIWNVNSVEVARIATTGNVLIGTSTDNGGKLQIKAPGALSTDIALRVRNSADTRNFLVVNGAGDVYNNGGGGVSTNTFFGENVGRSATGGNNTLIGNGVGTLITTGTENVLIGNLAGSKSTTASSNIAIGVGALRDVVNSNNLAIGYLSAALGTTANGNTSIGNFTIINNTTGVNNVVIGLSAGRYIADGITNLTALDNSILIGNIAKPLGNSQTNQIVIGDQAIGAGSNTATLGNTSIVDTVLRGRVNIKQYATASRPTYVKGALIYDSSLSKLVIGGATGWEVVTSI